MKRRMKCVTVMLAFVMVLAMAGCAVMNSKVVTEDEFKTVMEKRSMEVKDLSKSTIKYAEESEIETAKEAKTTDYDFCFVTVKDSDTAQKYYESFGDDMKATYTNGTSSNVSVGKNLEFTYETSEKYCKIIAKNSTIVSVVAAAGQKDTVKDIVKELGY